MARFDKSWPCPSCGAKPIIIYDKNNNPIGRKCSKNCQGTN